MKSLTTIGLLFFLTFFFLGQLFSQKIIKDNLQGDVKKSSKSVNPKGTTAGSDYLKKIEFQPYVVTENEPFSLTLEVKVNGIKSIIVYLQSKEYLRWDNNLVDSIILFDNGQNGDLKANDNVFTASNIKNGSY